VAALAGFLSVSSCCLSGWLFGFIVQGGEKQESAPVAFRYLVEPSKRKVRLCVHSQNRMLAAAGTAAAADTHAQRALSANTAQAPCGIRVRALLVAQHT
jgi:hypothetical protein